jgi:hypothetical protein
MELAVALKDSHAPDLHSEIAAVHTDGAEAPPVTAMLAAMLLSGSVVLHRPLPLQHLLPRARLPLRSSLRPGLPQLHLRLQKWSLPVGSAEAG